MHIISLRTAGCKLKKVSESSLRSAVSATILSSSTPARSPSASLWSWPLHWSSSRWPAAWGCEEYQGNVVLSYSLIPLGMHCIMHQESFSFLVQGVETRLQKSRGVWSDQVLRWGLVIDQDWTLCYCAFYKNISRSDKNMQVVFVKLLYQDVY